jgi:hypothetical protein
MKEHPILFNTEMVKAVLSGRKTQTRRVIKPQPNNGWDFEAPPVLGNIVSKHPKQGKFGVFLRRGIGTSFPEADVIVSPYGKVGDHLWVRETFYIDNIYYIDVPLSGKSAPEDDSIYYRSDGECCDQISECCCSEVGKVKWRPSIFMPRWASRITLEIVDIRVERVQNITLEDMLAEGLKAETYLGAALRSDWIKLWDSINDKRGFGWGVNPWVWVVEFKMI